ncbi:hypothetical protein G4O51_01440 [Candidatus Bathyarchaeota archaeon A05DMB-2]|nr:hypothetical protein [Candidatus Bathyarchaeota archaeon A05DMB-2]
MAYSHLPIKFWFYSAYQLQSNVSVKELSKTLYRPYTTVFRMVKKLRDNLYRSTSPVSLAVRWS